MLGRVRAERVIVFDRIEETELGSFVEFLGLDLDYALFSSNGVRVPSLEADDAVLYLRTTDPLNPNYGFLEALIRGPSTDFDPTPYVPRSARIDQFHLNWQTPAAQATLDGLHGTADFVSPDTFSVAARSGLVRFAWWGETNEVVEAFDPDNDVVDILVRRTPTGITVEPLRWNMPDLVWLDGAASCAIAPDQTTFEITLPKLVAKGHPAWRHMAAGAGVAIDFDALDLSGTHLHGIITEKGLAAPNSRVNLRAAGLRVGAAGQELYEGDLTVAGEALGKDGDEWQLDLVLAQGQRMRIKGRGDPSSATAALAFDDWSRDDLSGALPKDLRHHLQTACGLEKLSGALDVDWQKPAYAATGKFEALLTHSAAANQTAVVAFAGQGVWLGPAPMYEGAFELTAADGKVTGNLSVKTPTEVRAAAAFDRFDPMPWVEALLGAVAVENIRTVLTGAMDITLSGRPRTYGFGLDLAISPFIYRQKVLFGNRPLALEGDVTLDETGRTAMGHALEVRIGEDASFAFNDLAVSLADFSGRADVEGAFELELLALLAPVDGLAGRVALEAPAKSDRGIVSAPIEAVVESLAYNDFTWPGNIDAAISGRVNYDLLGGDFTGTGLVAAVSSGTRIAIPEWALTPSPFEFDAPFTLASDLEPLMDLGWADSALGSCAVSGRVTYSAIGFVARGDVEVAAEFMAVADSMVALEGASFEGALRYEGGLSGRGRLEAARGIVGGAVLSDVAGDVVFADDAARVTGWRAKLFGGTLEGDAVIGLLEEGCPVSLIARAERLDLEAFTREFKPPDIALTGIVEGEIRLELDAAGVQDVRAVLRSTENFSMNRDFLEQLLLSQYVGEGKGGKALAKVMADALGDAEQRPFDSAVLEIEHAGDEIAGRVALKSPKLNLDLDLHVDPDVLEDILELHQLSRLQKVENARPKPIQ